MTRALIIGGGIGGLTTARALAAAGTEVRIFERHPDLARIQVGGAIHIWHNGMRGLQRLGLAEPVQALGGPDAEVKRAEMRNWRGRLLAAWSPERTERELGAPTVGVIRPDLHRVLLAGAPVGALELGRECVAIEQDGSGVTARFADGSAATGDFLVGADGLRSAIRAAVHGEQPRRFAGYASWQAVCDYRDESTPPGLFWIVWGPGARFLFYRVGPERLYWEGIFATAAGGRDPEGSRREAVAARFEHWIHPIPAIIAATDPAAITRMDSYDLQPIKRWGEGRVTLLGDAAHAMTNAVGQGANTTIEDAVVLADRVSRHPGDPIAGLRAYEADRIGRTTRVVTLARTLTALSRWQRPGAVVVRDRIVTTMMVAGRRAQAKDMAYRF